MKVYYDNNEDRSEFTKKAFQVESTVCRHCEQRVNEALQGVEGVSVCSASAKDGIVSVERGTQKIDDATIIQAIIDTGYDVRR